MTDMDVQKLKKAGLSDDRIDEYKAAFEMFDPHRTGRITVENLQFLLNGKFEQEYGMDDLKYMLRQFSDTGEVDFFSFATSLNAKLADPVYNEAFGDAYDLLDVGRKGKLTKEDLITGMERMGEKLTDAEAEEMLKVATSKADFVTLMSKGVAGGAGMGGVGAGMGGGGGGGGGMPAPAAAAAPRAGGMPPRPVAARGPPRPGGAGPPRPGGMTPPRPGGMAPPRPGGMTPPRPGGMAPPRPGGMTPPRPGGAGPPRPGGMTPPRPGGMAPPRPGGMAPPRPGGMAPPRPGGMTPPRPGGFPRPPR